MRIVFFDIDGTLVLTQGAGKRAIEACLLEHFQVAQPNADIDYGGRTDRSLILELFTLNKLAEPSVDDVGAFFAAYVSCLSTELKESKSIVLPGIPALLDALAADSRYRLGIITGNIVEGAQAKLNHHDIAGYFDFGGYGNTAPRREDIAKEGLAAAEEFLGCTVRGDQCLVIGDTPHDIICSRAIDAYSVAVGTGYASPLSLQAEEPTVYFEDLSDTEKVLRAFDELFKS